MDNKPATLDQMAQEHGVSREKVRIMQFHHGLKSGRPEHDFNDGKNNVNCTVCGYTRGDNGQAEHESDRQKGK